jgi:glycosidase
MPVHRSPRRSLTQDIIYHIFIDRFRGYGKGAWHKPEFLGGNLQGIREALDYLCDLGVEALWLSPFYKALSYHGYNITDFYAVNPRFGSEQELRDLIVAAHQRGLKIIADFVPNHLSREHPFFRDACADKKSEYHDWFYFTRWPDRYRCFLSYGELPKINLDHRPAREHIIGAALHWLAMGVDGLRLDHAIGPAHDFWCEFRDRVKERFPDVTLIGEVCSAGVTLRHYATVHMRYKLWRMLTGLRDRDLFYDYVGLLDGVLDFEVQGLIKDYVCGRSHVRTRLQLEQSIKRHYAAFPAGFCLPAFLDNHDMERFLFVCKGDRRKFKEAFGILFDLPQPIILYYGSEAGMTQDQWHNEWQSHGDLQARQPMPWPPPDADLLTFFRELIAGRKKKYFQGETPACSAELKR